MPATSSRRDFLGGALAAALFGISDGEFELAPLPSGTGAPDDEAFWAELRRDQFLIPAWRAYLNNGSLGVCPRKVVRVVCDSVVEGARRERFGEYPRWGYEEMAGLRDRLAAFVGTTRDHLALTHNATHAMYLVAGGLDLEAGDEVILTDQEHATCNGTWDQQAARQGIVVKRVPIPVAPMDPAATVEKIAAAITPRTRVLVFSEILTTTGGRMPTAELCTLARDHGVISVVDGAHCPGQVPLDLDALGADAFCGSPHKWLLAPAGSGFLVLSDTLMDRLWCANGAHWWDRKDMKAQRFMGLGTNNSSVVDGLGASLDWFDEIGPKRIYARQHALAASAYQRASALPGVGFATADDPAQYAAMVCFGVEGLDLKATDAALREQGLWTTRVGPRYRLSCHVHVRPQDLDTFFEVVERQVSAQGL